MKKYKYNGGLMLSVSLNYEEKKEKKNISLTMVHGEHYILPESNDFIKSLVSKGYLIPATAKK